MNEQKIVNVPFPFVLEEYSGPKDGDFFEGKSWRPGVRFEIVHSGRCSGEPDSITVADGMGNMVLEVVSIHRPGRYPERTFYLRSFIDPGGRTFGKPKLRVASSAAFRKLSKGYMHHFEMSDLNAAQATGESNG